MLSEWSQCIARAWAEHKRRERDRMSSQWQDGRLLLAVLGRRSRDVLSDLCLISWNHRSVGCYRGIDISQWRTRRKYLSMRRSQKRRRYNLHLFSSLRNEEVVANIDLYPVMASCHSFHQITGLWRALIRRHEHTAYRFRRINRIWRPVSYHVHCVWTTCQWLKFSNLRSQRSRCLGPPE